MNLPYRLQNYKSKLNLLSPQALSILEFVASNSSCQKFKKRIEEEEELEFESLQILNRGILGGYSNTIYTYNWEKEEELSFWELVNLKSKNIGLSYLILANNSRFKKSLIETKELYFKAFELSSQAIFSIEEEDRKLFYEEDRLRYDFLRYEVNAWLNIWDDFENDLQEQMPYWEKTFGKDEKAMAIINEVILEKKKTV